MKRYYWPFQIKERISPVAYRLQLPKGARIHPVFHCSMLKPFKGSPEKTKPIELPPTFTNNQLLISPLAILDYRRRSSEPNATWKVLVQWHGLSSYETSWEDWPQLCQDFHLEDKVTLQGSRDDTETGAAKGITQAMNTKAETGVQVANKPKRRITKPTYLNDYV